MTVAYVRFFLLLAVCAMSLLGPDPGKSNSASRYQPMPCRSFVETGKTVCGRFLLYWEKNGGLPQQGFPISGEFRELSDVDGKSYNVQYFERAVFELHPENKSPFDVLLSLVGNIYYK